MIVILKRDVKGTGKAGEIVKVSDGYARNMLLPKGYAMEATKGNVRDLEKAKERQKEEEAEKKAKAIELKEKLEKTSVTIRAKAGEGGRLFGAVTTKDIADAMERDLGIKMDKKKISIDQPIKNLGEFEAKLKLYTDVNGSLTVKVTE